MMFSPYKLIGFVVAPLGVATLIGTGFALWVFTDSLPEANDSITNEVKVTSLVEDGTFKIVQSPSLLVFSEGTLGESSLFDGITFYTEKNVGQVDANGNPLTTTDTDSTFIFRYYYEDPNLVDESVTGLKLHIGIAFDLLTNAENATTEQEMEEYLEISSNLRNPNYGYRQINGEGDYYFFITDNESYAETTLNFEITEGNDYFPVAAGEKPYQTKYIQYSVALNQFLRYENTDKKPLDFEKFSALSDAASEGNREFSIRLVGYFSYI